jgi:hypothetical protein
MTAVAPGRAPTPRLVHRSGSSISVEPTSTEAAVSSGLKSPSTQTDSRPAPVPRRSGRVSPTDALSDEATAAFVRRVLCPQHQLGEKGRNTPLPIQELLPPLTSRNDVDLQLYAFIAIILREFVQTWYGKLTPDETFVAEIVQILAHCTRGLEQRLRKVDLESLLFDEIPDLFDRHITGKLELSKKKKLY